MIRLLLLFLSTISLSAYTINFDKRFDLDLKPDTLTTHINITTIKPTEKEVLKKLTSFSTFISGYKDVEKKGGNYSVNAEYRYENNQRYKNGYRGHMNYQISSKKAEDMNTFIMNLHEKKKDFDVDISISNVSWQLSPAQKEGQEDRLRLQAFRWISDYAKTLSKELGNTCTVSKISLNAVRNNYPRPMMEAKSMMADGGAPTPEQDIQKISINPHFELEYK
jgi:uncharacterized protein YggE